MKTTIIVFVIVTAAVAVLLFLRQPTPAKQAETPRFSQEEYDRHYEAKKQALDRP